MVDDSPLTKFKKRVKKTIAVPSLSRDSPSTRVLNLTLAPNYFKRATTATGSVADRTQPRVSASYQLSSSSGYSKIILKQKAIRIAPQRTPGPARVKILTKDFLKTCHSQLKAKNISYFST